MQKYSEILDEYYKITVDSDYRETIKKVLIAYNPIEMKKYGLKCDASGELVISDALNQILDPNICDADDISLIIGKLSKQTLWLQTKPVRDMTLFIHHFIDRKHKKNRYPTTCKKGCSACCHKTINIFPDEGALIQERTSVCIPIHSNETACPFLKENICSICQTPNS